MEIFGVSHILLIQAVINGVMLGLIYAALAAGLSLTMGVMGIVNVAHSTLIILGSFAVLETTRNLGLDPLLSLVIIMPLFFVLGALLERGIVSRVVESSPTTGLLALFGILVIIESLAIIVWTTNTQTINVNYGRAIIVAQNYFIPRPRLFAATASLVIIGAMYIMLQHTMLGRGIRAMSQNRNAAELMGIDVKRMSLIVFGVGTATAAAGGAILAMVFPFTPQDHIKWLAWAFLVVVVGGLGNIRNTLIAGLVVGLTETISGTLLPFQYVSVVIYGFLALALMVRGQGLAGSKARTI